MVAAPFVSFAETCRTISEALFSVACFRVSVTFSLVTVAVALEPETVTSVGVVVIITPLAPTTPVVTSFFSSG